MIQHIGQLPGENKKSVRLGTPHFARAFPWKRPLPRQRNAACVSQTSKVFRTAGNFPSRSRFTHPSLLCLYASSIIYHALPTINRDGPFPFCKKCYILTHPVDYGSRQQCYSRHVRENKKPTPPSYDAEQRSEEPPSPFLCASYGDVSKFYHKSAGPQARFQHKKHPFFTQKYRAFAAPGIVFGCSPNVPLLTNPILFLSMLTRYRAPWFCVGAACAEKCLLSTLAALSHTC